MLIISGREFRANQSSYLDKVDAGQQIILKRRGNKSYRIIPVNDDDTIMNQEEYCSKLDEALEQYVNGQFTTVRTKDDLNNFLDAL